MEPTICADRSTKSDVAKERIERMEPHVGFLGELNLKGEDIKILKEAIQTGEYDTYGNIKLSSTTKGCTFCSKDSSYLVSRRLSNPTGTYGYRDVISICCDCLGRFLEEAEMIMNYLENIYYYYDESGFLVKEISKDAFNCSKHRGEPPSNEGLEVLIGCRTPTARTGISEFKQFITESLRTRETHDCTASCSVCGDRSSRIFSINYKKETVLLCGFCKKDLERNSKKYIEDNLEEILSKTI